MSLRLEMLQVARLAPKVLGDSTRLVADFLRSQQCSETVASGQCPVASEDKRPASSLATDNWQLATDHWPLATAFVDREGKSDLYYTVFGIEGLLALQEPLPADCLRSYLRSFGDGANLDLVHLSCLIRCWAGLPPAQRQEVPVDRLLDRLASFHTSDGGFGLSPEASLGSLYGCFMVVGAYQDLAQPLPNAGPLLDFVKGLRDPQGGYFNGLDMPVSLVPSTAAAVCLLRHLGADRIDPGVGDWLLSCFHPQGGFRMHPESPMPDLLSTATALHALSSLKIPLDLCQEPTLDFIDTLWNSRGGFCGNWEDDKLDCEYTYYALLSLGHCSI